MEFHPAIHQIESYYSAVHRPEMFSSALERMQGVEKILQSNGIEIPSPINLSTGPQPIPTFEETPSILPKYYLNGKQVFALQIVDFRYVTPNERNSGFSVQIRFKEDNLPFAYQTWGPNILAFNRPSIGGYLYSTDEQALLCTEYLNNGSIQYADNNSFIQNAIALKGTVPPHFSFTIALAAMMEERHVARATWPDDWHLKIKESSPDPDLDLQKAGIRTGFELCTAKGSTWWATTFQDMTANDWILVV